MALTNDDIQSRNRQLQGDLAGAQAQRANLTALRTASKPTANVSFAGATGGVGATGGTALFRSPIDKINYGVAVAGLRQNDATMAGITNRAHALTDDANAFTAQQKAAGFGVVPVSPSRPKPTTSLASSGVDPLFAGAQTGGNSSYASSGIDPLFKGAATGTGIAPGDSPAYKSPIDERNEKLASQYGNPAAAQMRSINLGASRDVSGSYFGSGGFGGGGSVRTDLASSVDKNGVPTFDNNSIARLIKRNGGDAVPPSGAETFPRPLLASYPVPSQQAIGYSIGAAGIGVNDRRGRIVSDLDSAIARAAINPNSRSKRELLSQLVATKQGYINNQDATAAGAEQAALAQKGELQRAMIGQDGEDRRQQGALQTQITLEGMRQEGENTRYARSMRGPITIGDKIGTISDDGVTFRPIIGADGKAMVVPQKADAGGRLDQNDALQSIDREYKSLLDNYPSVTPERQAVMQQRMDYLQSQRDRIRGFNSVAPTQAEAIAAAKQQIQQGQMTPDEAKKKLVQYGYSTSGL